MFVVISKSLRKLLRTISLLLGLIVLTLSFNQPVQAAGTVTNCSSYGAVGTAGTLADALNGGGAVTFSCDGTITVPRISITANTTLDASGRSVTLSGSNTNPVMIVQGSATVAITNLTIADGQVTAGTHSPNEGGGILNYGTLTVNSSTIRDNTGTNGTGAGIYNQGTLVLNNTTLSGNVTTGRDGGGLYTDSFSGSATLNNSTVTDNSADGGSGIYGGGNLTLNNTIVADQRSGVDCGGSTSSITSGGNNLDSDGTCNLNASGDQSNVGAGNAKLDALTVNSPGNTATHALQTGSPAIDAGNNSTCLSTDQRGVSRPQGTTCDIGAHESGGGSSGSSPELTIPSTTIAVPADNFSIPINLTTNGASVATTGFSIDFDQTCLTFDITDDDSNGVPNAITGIPSSHVATVSYDGSDSDGELDIGIIDQLSPLNALSDGAILTIEFGVKNQPSCRPTNTTLDVSIGFSSSPAVSFGDTSGGSVSGTATGATVPLQFNATPTDITLSANSVAENQASGTDVGTLSTTDTDSGDTHTYTLVSGDTGSFSITGSTLKTAAVFDFETTASYNITIRTDDGNGGTFDKAFTINVTNVNEAPTDIALSAIAINENLASGTLVGTLSTTDVDTGDSHTYTLVSGDTGSFSIVGSNLNTAAIFDTETQASYNITIRTSDGALTFDKAFVITVNNVNEAPTATNDTIDPATQVMVGATDIAVLANDVDPDTGDNTPLSISAVGTPSNGTASINGNNVTYTANAGYNGADTFTYTASDGSLTHQGTVSVWAVADVPRGDCNGDSSVNAGDFSAISLEIFDGDDASPWYEVHGSGSYQGSPQGCDANGGQSIQVGDLVCTVNVFFGASPSSCTTLLAASHTETSTAASLAIDAELSVASSQTLNVPVSLQSNGYTVAAAAFSLGFDRQHLTFDPSDADQDGVPDAITLHLPSGMLQIVRYNTVENRVEFALAGLSQPMPTLADGPIATVQLQIASNADAEASLLRLGQASLGSTLGQDIPLDATDSILQIDSGGVHVTDVNSSIYLPLIAFE